MFLEIKNLKKEYNGKKVLDKLSFGLEKGKMLCILGPSGCGKTTVLRALGGFIDFEGSLVLDGRDITDLAPEERNISTVFQSFGLFPHMNVIKNVTYGLKFKDINKKDALVKGSEILERVGLGGYETRAINKLSGGEQQRVALARSLIVNPSLLLLDEPLSSLDAKLRKKMRGEIKRIQRDFGVTSIFVTHDQEEAFEVADEIILLNHGKIMQRGSGLEIYNRPQNKFTLDFIGSHNTLEDGYVRPERVKIVKEGKEAIIEEIIFQGQTIDLVLQDQTGKLLATILNQDFNYRVGDKVNIAYEKKIAK